MLRLFRQHYIRECTELDGMWDFKMNGSNQTYRMPVPGCWEQHPDFVKYRGNGVYTKDVYIAKSGAVRLVFKGVSHTADVYFDGEKIAHHYNAFTPFSAVVKNAAAGEHHIRVEADNTFGVHSALHVPNDYYTYGGIIRSVAMERISSVYIENVHFTPFIKNGVWMAKIEVEVSNLLNEKAAAELKITVAGITASHSIEIDAQSTKTAVLEQTFDSVKPWSHEEPNLYMLNAVLYIDGEEVDDLIDRVGFRTVEICGTKIKLNGREIFLKGFNRHEDYASLGCAVPFQLMVRDMDLMQDMGANALRTCHYPNDELFLDMCDERGIMVWEENHARGLGIDGMNNPNFDQQCEDCIREMIGNHYNHPSIIIWGILNECASHTEEGREKYKKQYEQIKSMDKSRPTTSATCQHFKDICLDLPDIVSFNQYTGWYEECPYDERKDREIDWIKKSGGENKPIIVSEFGAAAVYGYRDRSRCKWSEEGQADIIRNDLEVYMNDENISGVFIWQFADCHITEESIWYATRARCHNNKGIVDEYRRPKIAYDVIKEMFH